MKIPGLRVTAGSGLPVTSEKNPDIAASGITCVLPVDTGADTEVGLRMRKYAFPADEESPSRAISYPLGSACRYPPELVSYRA